MRVRPDRFEAASLAVASIPVSVLVAFLAHDPAGWLGAGRTITLAGASVLAGLAVLASVGAVLGLTGRRGSRTAGSLGFGGLAAMGTDHTGLPVLDRDHPNGIQRGHIWAYLSDGGSIYYEFTADWSIEKPRPFLSRRKGIIHADDYAGHAALFGPDSGRIKAGCWAHCRRKLGSCPAGR
jgi:hypothetical protein